MLPVSWELFPVVSVSFDYNLNGDLKIAAGNPEPPAHFNKLITQMSRLQQGLTMTISFMSLYQLSGAKNIVALKICVCDLYKNRHDLFIEKEV